MDYELYSPVVRHTSICVLLALVSTLDMELEQLNIEISFLHERLEEDILIQQHTSFEVEQNKNFVCRLKRPILGLKQSSRQCYKRFNEFIFSHVYIRSPYDSCVYMLIASQNYWQFRNWNHYSVVNLRWRTWDLSKRFWAWRSRGIESGRSFFCVKRNTFKKCWIILGWHSQNQYVLH